MSRWVIALIGGLLVANALGIQARDGQAFAWDYPAHQAAELNIVRFEIRLDGRESVSAGMSILPGTSESYFTPLREMPSGQHAVEVRACNFDQCYQWSAPMFFVVSPFFDVVQVQQQFGASFDD